jgi:glycosyltransferase involved in cell wall biosynthesis
MWAKNGEEYLPAVLKQIDNVIPKGCVNKKIFVDDSSTDCTVEIAEDLNWQVYRNTEGGVAGGAREALRHVEAEFFVSVEQDILLARDWYSKISPYMNDPMVLTAQGIRLATDTTLRRLAEYEYRNNRKGLGYSVDNNLFRTALLHKLGGFSNKDPMFVDYTLREAVSASSYKWIVDETVVSDHIRRSVLQTIRKGYHQEMLSTSKREDTSFHEVFRSALTSPVSGFSIGVKTRCPQIVVVYPLLRFGSLKTFLHKRGS